MQLDRKKIEKILDSAQKSMFAVLQNLDFPEELMDRIFIQREKQALADLIAWAKANNQISDRQKTLLLDISSWALSTISLMMEFGFEIAKEIEGAENN
jgi:hypothetical protein